MDYDLYRVLDKVSELKRDLQSQADYLTEDKLDQVLAEYTQALTQNKNLAHKIEITSDPRAFHIKASRLLSGWKSGWNTGSPQAVFNVSGVFFQICLYEPAPQFIEDAEEMARYLPDPQFIELPQNVTEYLPN